MAETNCPCCDQPLPTNVGLLWKNTYIHEGIGVELTPIMSEILQFLMTKRGQYIKSGRIIENIYGTNEEWPEWKTINVHLHYLRARFKAAGVPCPIISRRAIGHAYKPTTETLGKQSVNPGVQSVEPYFPSVRA